MLREKLNKKCGKDIYYITSRTVNEEFYLENTEIKKLSDIIKCFSSTYDVKHIVFYRMDYNFHRGCWREVRWTIKIVSI